MHIVLNSFTLLVIYLPGVAVHIGGLSRLVRDTVVNTGTGLWLNAAAFTVKHHPRWTHTAGHARRGHLQNRSYLQSTARAKYKMCRFHGANEEGRGEKGGGG